jgi:hypothetical protein
MAVLEVLEAVLDLRIASATLRGFFPVRRCALIVTAVDEAKLFNVASPTVT